MNPASSYYDNTDDIDLVSAITEMSNTIDALNTNIILLNKFIESALNITDNTYFKENVEITTFDSSGNVMTCVKSDGSGNFIPCAFMDLSSNMLPCVLPPNIKPNINGRKQRCFSPYSPYYYPYGGYGPYGFYGSYYPYYSSLLNDDSIYRDIPPKKPTNHNLQHPILPPTTHQNAHPDYRHHYYPPYLPQHPSNYPFSTLYPTNIPKKPSSKKDSNVHVYVHP
jgi:hypothetical protein